MIVGDLLITRGHILIKTMKNRFFIYVILGLGQIVTGILGSYFAFVVSGTFMLFKGLDIILNNAKKTIRSIVYAVVSLLCVYFMYYSFAMLISELDYALVRPEIWIAMPISVMLLVLISMILSAEDKLILSDTPDSALDVSAAKTDLLSSVEDMTIFALIFVGWIGTFVFDFYFEYAAAICTAICILKNIYDLIFTTTQHKQSLPIEE